jgi:predicted MFS family arabinose efflux permease
MSSVGVSAVSAPVASSRWALLFGNFAIGCGVMVVPGSLNDMTHSLQVSVAVAGQLIAMAAAVMCFGAPLLAAAVAGWDRRRLLALALAWYALGHALSALMPGYAPLAAVRMVTMLGAAVFTPQAAAAIGTMAAASERGRAITFIFLGWSVASVLGMPLASFVGESFGWRYAFGMVALLAAIGSAWVWAVVPDGVKPPALNLAAWREVFTHPVLMAIVLVTALQGSGQFTVFSYFAPYYRQVIGATPAQVSLLFFWFGACGLVGNVLLTRYVDRLGAARAVAFTIVLIGASLALWELAHDVVTMALVLIPWGLGCFATNSAQQARLGQAAPALAPALMALNTSAIYLGQAAGAAGGGALLAAQGLHALWPVGLLWVAASLALSVWAARRMRGRVSV